MRKCLYLLLLAVLIAPVAHAADTAAPLPADDKAAVACISNSMIDELKKVKEPGQAQPLMRDLAKQHNPIYAQCPALAKENFVGTFCTMVVMLEHARQMALHPGQAVIDKALKESSAVPLKESETCLSKSTAMGSEKELVASCQADVDKDAEALRAASTKAGAADEDALAYFRMSIQEVFMWRKCMTDKELFAE